MNCNYCGYDVAAMQEALEFYADPNNWVRTGYPDEGPISEAENDGGLRARAALTIK